MDKATGQVLAASGTYVDWELYSLNTIHEALDHNNHKAAPFPLQAKLGQTGKLIYGVKGTPMLRVSPNNTRGRRTGPRGCRCIKGHQEE
jgi:hypothetical protein